MGLLAGSLNNSLIDHAYSDQMDGHVLRGFGCTILFFHFQMMDRAKLCVMFIVWDVVL